MINKEVRMILEESDCHLGVWLSKRRPYWSAALRSRVLSTLGKGLSLCYTRAGGGGDFRFYHSTTEDHHIGLQVMERSIWNTDCVLHYWLTIDQPLLPADKSSSGQAAAIQSTHLFPQLHVPHWAAARIKWPHWPWSYEPSFNQYGTANI